LDLKADEIHHKLVFKILHDVWVRYQLDGRPARKFIVRKGKSLVLRAAEKVQFQVSNPKFLTFNYNGQGVKLLSKNQDGVEKQGNMTFFFPTELSGKVEKPFEDDKPLPQIETPESDSSDQDSESGT
jgi:hypothetical protein